MFRQPESIPIGAKKERRFVQEVAETTLNVSPPVLSPAKLGDGSSLQSSKLALTAEKNNTQLPMFEAKTHLPSTVQQKHSKVSIVLPKSQIEFIQRSTVSQEASNNSPSRRHGGLQSTRNKTVRNVKTRSGFSSPKNEKEQGTPSGLETISQNQSFK